jgi:hypothetical protein
MQDFVQSLFARLRDQAAKPADQARTTEGPCATSLALAVEYVVDQVWERLRAAPGYAKVLREPVETALRYVDGMAEHVPGPLRCSRETFAVDADVNAFFVSPDHLQEVFSQSEEVRRLFDGDPEAEECWALLCMQTKERHGPGMALVRGQIQRDVMQTRVSFCEHQVMAPGRSERDARQALKCCIFSGMLGFIRQRLEEATQRTANVQVLRTRLRQLGTATEMARRRTELKIQLAAEERALAAQGPAVADIADKLHFVADLLSHPSALVSATQRPLHLSRLGVRIGEQSDEPGYRLQLAEIQIAAQAPRVGALVRFPRQELLPPRDFLRQADLFLSQAERGIA